MACVKDDNLFQALPADRADHAFDVSVLQQGARCRDALSDSHRRDPLAEDRAVRGVAVTQQKAGSCVPRKTLQLPAAKRRSRGMPRNIEPHNLSATVGQDDHDVEQSKGPTRRRTYRWRRCRLLRTHIPTVPTENSESMEKPNDLSCR